MGLGMFDGEEDGEHSGVGLMKILNICTWQDAYFFGHLMEYSESSPYLQYSFKPYARYLITW